jgi:hypothetical protein
MESNSTFRERAGVVASYMIITGYILIGFVQYGVGAWLGVDATFDQAWSGAMNGLAGGAVGFLIGKQTTNTPSVSVPVVGDSVSTRTTVTSSDAG